MRFLHLADVHLDTPFAGRSPRLRARLRQAGREALGRAFTRAMSDEVDAVLIAGDLFDGVRLSFETERFLTDQLAELDAAGIPVVYATGNHDPGRDGGWIDRLAWPAGVQVVPDAAPRRLAIRGAGGEVIGHVTAAGHAGPRETRDLASDFPRPGDTRPEVALLHARVVGSRDAESHEPYAPAELETLVRSGYPYWALGHVHERQTLSERPFVHYPGNLQGRTHAEDGPRGCSLVELGADGDVTLDFVPCGPVRWETLVLDGLDEVRNVDDLVVRVRRRWDALREADPAPGVDWMIRLDLLGGIPLWRRLAEPENRTMLARELVERLDALDVEVRADRTHAVVDPADHDERRDVLGVALRRLREIRSGEAPVPDDWLTELAGPAAGLVDGPVDAWARELLDDAEGELLARLLDLEAQG